MTPPPSHNSERPVPQQFTLFSGSNLAFVRRFDPTVLGGDGLAPNDKFFVANINGDSRQHVYVYKRGRLDHRVSRHPPLQRIDSRRGWQSNWISS
jgi:hypothetical protein